MFEILCCETISKKKINNAKLKVNPFETDGTSKSCYLYSQNFLYFINKTKSNLTHDFLMTVLSEIRK